MRASNTFPNDLEKVMDVTKDQILMALSKEPTSMDKFTEDLPKFGKIFFSGYKQTVLLLFKTVLSQQDLRSE